MRKSNVEITIFCLCKQINVYKRSICLELKCFRDNKNYKSEHTSQVSKDRIVEAFPSPDRRSKLFKQGFDFHMINRHQLCDLQFRICGCRWTYLWRTTEEGNHEHKSTGFRLKSIFQPPTCCMTNWIPSYRTSSRFEN